MNIITMEKATKEYREDGTSQSRAGVTFHVYFDNGTGVELGRDELVTLQFLCTKALEDSAPKAALPSSPGAVGLSTNAKELADCGRRIDAIKQQREDSGSTLVAAVNIVREYMDGGHA